MCNCENKKNSYLQQQPDTGAAAGNVPVQNIIVHIIFQYTGKTGLTVSGNVTRNRYRFNYTGDIQPIDSRDAAGMMGIAVLRRLQ